jgi:tetratricopeptide (TPR) repeat protein
MLARYSFLGLIALGAAGAAASLVPGDLEHVAMLQRDGRHEAAMAELDRQYTAGRRDTRAVLALYNLKVRFGDLDTAQRLLEEHARSRPRDMQAQIGLIRFYQATQQQEAYVASLAGLNERTRSRELQNELLGFYRLNGRHREEEELLERAAKVNRAGPAEFERMGLLAAARGDMQRAARALRRADGRLDEQSQPARLSLFRILVELREYDEAHGRALAWLRTWRDPNLVVDLMNTLAQAGRVDLALDLSGRSPGGAVSLRAAEILTANRRGEEALVRLKEVQPSGLIEDRLQATRYISVAISARQAKLALTTARHLGLRKLPAETVADLVDLLRDDAAGPRTVSREQLKGFSAEIEARMANRTPVGDEVAGALMLPGDLRLYATELAIRDGDRDLARRMIAVVSPSELDGNGLLAWADLQLRLGVRAQAIPNVTGGWRKRQVSELLARRARLQTREQAQAARRAQQEATAAAQAAAQTAAAMPEVPGSAAPPAVPQPGATSGGEAATRVSAPAAAAVSTAAEEPAPPRARRPVRRQQVPGEAERPREPRRPASQRRADPAEKKPEPKPPGYYFGIPIPGPGGG